jgi:type I restriction enzyme S subunit
MNVPDNYKLTEVGIIPKDWNVMSLGEDIILLSGYHALADHCNTHGDGFPYLTGPSDFPKGRIQQTKFTTTPTTFCQADDILVTVKGSGSGTLIEADASYCISRQLMAIRVKKWNGKFLYFSLLQNASRIKAASTGLIPGLSRSDILGQQIPIPNNLSEQHAIAEALSDIDRLIEWLEKLIVKKRAIKHGMMQQLLTDKARLAQFDLTTSYKQTEVGMIPEDWEVGTLQSCLQSSPMYGINAPAVEYDDNYPTYLRITDISDDGRYCPSPKVCVAHSDAKNYLLTKGDIVFARTGASVGKSYLYNPNDGELVFAGFLIRVIPDSRMLDSKYLFYYTQTKQYWDWVVTMSVRSGQPGINGREYGQLRFPLPNIDEQCAISSILVDIDTEIDILECRYKKTHAIKQGIMQSLLTGRVRLVNPPEMEVKT